MAIDSVESRMICNSAYLADKQKVRQPSDVLIFAELGRPEKLRIIEALADGPAKPKDLLEALELETKRSGNLSRWLADLVSVNLISRDPESTTWGAYYLVDPKATNELLDAATALAAGLSRERADAAAAQAEVDAAKAAKRKRRRRSTGSG